MRKKRAILLITVTQAIENKSPHVPPKTISFCFETSSLLFMSIIIQISFRSTSTSNSTEETNGAVVTKDRLFSFAGKNNFTLQFWYCLTQKKERNIELCWFIASGGIRLLIDGFSLLLEFRPVKLANFADKLQRAVRCDFQLQTLSGW